MASSRTRSTTARRAMSRVLVSGMGGELGSLVAAQLEREPWVGEIAGCDVDPPRRRLRRARFHLIEPHDQVRTAELVRRVDPHVIVHVGVYEPGARANPGNARHRSLDAAAAIFGEATRLASLRAVVVRSGIEVYGRLGGAAIPDEATPIGAARAATTFGRILLDVEDRARAMADATGLPVALIRLAPVIGPHIPSPLGRLLRLPVVPFDPLRRARFSVVDIEDAARALVAAARHEIDGPINVVANGSITPRGAIGLGGRISVPVVGPGWWAARQATALAGAPVPDHVVELLLHGRRASSLRADDAGVVPVRSTRDAIEALYAWPSVTRVTRPAAVHGHDDSAIAARRNNLRIVNG